MKFHRFNTGNMQTKLMLFILILLAFISFTTYRPAAGWHPIFENDTSGRTIYGDKKALLKAIKSSSPIRVAWGEKLSD